MIKCIYHGGCPDGFGAAMAVVQEFGAEAVELIPVGYGSPLPENVDKTDYVYVVDFSFSPAETRELANRAGFVHVLDHHETAFNAWSETGAIPVGEREEPCEVVPSVYEDALYWDARNISVIIDMKRSGAGITWDEVCDYRPALIDYVEDRDLWRWSLPNSRQVGCLILTLEHTIEAWQPLLTKVPLEELIERGRGAMAFQEAAVREAVERAQFVEVGLGLPKEERRSMWLTQSPYITGSRVAEALIEEHDVDEAAYWLMNVHGEFQYGIRGRGDHSVREFAEANGGGGHKLAAGFKALHPLHVLGATTPAE